MDWIRPIVNIYIYIRPIVNIYIYIYIYIYTTYSKYIHISDPRSLGSGVWVLGFGVRGSGKHTHVSFRSRELSQWIA